MSPEQIILGAHTIEELEIILRKASHIGDPGERIGLLSSHLLGTAYAEATLIGDDLTPEMFVINLKGVDCMTFVEYIEAMRISSSFPGLIASLKRVRYKSGIVDFHSRNHFFSDWRESNRDLIEDLTERIGGAAAVLVRKKLNEKEDGTSFLQGIQAVTREISYIPSGAVDSRIIENLRTGDYIGIFSPIPGLDVSHTGIMVRQNEIVYLRHASSHPENSQVVDQDFRNYIVGVPGIIVYRPKRQH
jgi:hypothetical protein